MDSLQFRSQDQKHKLSALNEEKIKNMGNAGRNSGEYYTPRPLIRAMIAVTKPRIGERIYDGAVGSAGFLCEAHDYLRQGNLTTSQLEILQTKTFYGKEKKSLAYVIAIRNMILHGIDAPNIIHTNTLAENISDIQEKDRYDVILANPPFGGKERNAVQQNFPIKTGNPAPSFGDYPADFFDFIIIDECHRGGANDESNWRAIMEYSSPAVQLGLTATPKRKNNVDTYNDFGEPIYTYSLKEDINDGYLTPFKVKQIATTLDDYIYTSDDTVIEGEIEEGRNAMKKMISIELL